MLATFAATKFTSGHSVDSRRSPHARGVKSSWTRPFGIGSMFSSYATDQLVEVADGTALEEVPDVYGKCRDDGFIILL